MRSDLAGAEAKVFPSRSFILLISIRRSEKVFIRPDRRIVSPSSSPLIIQSSSSFVPLVSNPPPFIVSFSSSPKISNHEDRSSEGAPIRSIAKLRDSCNLTHAAGRLALLSIFALQRLGCPASQEDVRCSEENTWLRLTDNLGQELTCDIDDLWRSEAQFELMASWQFCSLLSLPVPASRQG